MRILLYVIGWSLLRLTTCAQPVPPAGVSQPVLPGYFADPTIKKFGDLYYIYATTDNEMLASGAPTVWYSSDFQNWYNYIMEVPSLSEVNLRNFWAPDIIAGTDGKYYLYFGNCQSGCNIYGYVSDTPVGPWAKLNEDDTPVIPHHYPREGFPSLDAQFFRDTDGKVYAYWGTWVHYNNGYAVGELDTETMSEMKDGQNIALSQTPEPFEAAYMMKKGDKYILMYSGGSCHDDTYNVRYAYADSPYGPFTPGANNPILSTNTTETVHGPGHHSVLQEGEEYYIVYHKHDYPMTRGGLSRQVCVDRMIFENDSTLQKIESSADGIKDLIKKETPDNLTMNVKATASSFYQFGADEYAYKPSYAVDNNNATLWKAGNNTFPQNLILDLGETKTIGRVATQFEFASYYYQYRIEYSVDGKNWQLYVDRSENRTPGSPMIDDKAVKTRYLKLSILATEKTGTYAAVWNVKVYGSTFDVPLGLTNIASQEGPGAVSRRELMVQLDANKIADKTLAKVSNQGTIGGTFTKSGEVAYTTDEVGIQAIRFTEGALTLNVPVPKRLDWNGSFSVAVWVKNPGVGSEGECLMSWCDRFKYQLANSYNALYYNSGNYGAAGHLDRYFDMAYKNLPEQNQWHQIVLTFDGVMEKIYVNGALDNAQMMMLSSAIDQAKIRVGASDVGENFSGYLASLRLYDYALSEKEIKQLMKSTMPKPNK